MLGMQNKATHLFWKAWWRACIGLQWHTLGGEDQTIWLKCALTALLGRVALIAQWPIVIKLSRGRSVGRRVSLSVCPSVCPIHCGMADRIRMLFGIIGRTGSGMRHVVRFGDRSTGRGTFGVNLVRAIVTNGDFMVYVCDSAATRPSSQITLG